MTKEYIMKLFDDTEYYMRSIPTATSDVTIDIKAIRDINTDTAFDEFTDDDDILSVQNYCRDKIELLRKLFNDMTGLNLNELDYHDFLDTLDLFISRRNFKIAKAIINIIKIDKVKYAGHIKNIFETHNTKDVSVVWSYLKPIILEEHDMSDILEEYFLEQCLLHAINIDFDGTQGFYDVFIHRLSEFDDDTIMEFSEVDKFAASLLMSVFIPEQE